jgi:uncharacterized protein
MVTWRSLSWALILLLLVGSGSLAGPGAIGGRQDSAVGGVERHSLKDTRDRYVVKQQFDYSCGASALATLLTYYFGDGTSEQDVLKILMDELTKDERRLKTWRGFSLLDLKHTAEAKGYRAAGFKLTIEQLMQLAAPVIVFVRPLGYAHFAVLRGIDRGRVFLADPARGNLRMSIARFLGEWEGIVFVLGKAGEEHIKTYPLALPRPEHIQPELLSVDRRWNWQVSMIPLPIRSQLR